MARLITAAMEIAANSTGGVNNLEFAAPAQTGVKDTTTKRISGASWKQTMAGALAYCEFSQFPRVLGTTYFIRAYLAVSGFPTSTALSIFSLLSNAGATEICNVSLSSAGVIVLNNVVGGGTLGNSQTIQLNVFYRFEIKILLATGSTDALEFRVDGNPLYSATGLTLSDIAFSTVRLGWLGTDAGGKFIWIDDVAINDSNGTDQNSFPGDGHIVYLFPASDSSRVGFTTGAAGTTNLWDAVNNEPPIGVIATSGTATSQIKDATNNITDNYVANMQSYTVAGIPTGAVIKLVQPFADFGGSTTVAQSIGITVVTNPAGSEDVKTGNAALVGTWDTGWAGFWGTAIYNPAVTFGTGPTMKVRQNTASTVTRSVDVMGIAVEFTTPSLVYEPRRVARNSLLRR